MDSDLENFDDDILLSKLLPRRSKCRGLNLEEPKGSSINEETDHESEGGTEEPTNVNSKRSRAGSTCMRKRHLPRVSNKGKHKRSKGGSADLKRYRCMLYFTTN